VLEFLMQPGGLTAGRLYWNVDLLIPWGVPPEDADRIRKTLLRRFPSRETDAQFKRCTHQERRALAERIADTVVAESAARTPTGTSVKPKEVSTLNWAGPFVMLPQSEIGLPNALGRDGCVGTGIYMLTVECDAGYRVNYVGETGTSIHGRLTAHYEESSSGAEGKAAEPAKFRMGIREIHRFDRIEFQANRAKWSEWIDDNYRAYGVFLATADSNPELGDQATRRDVEAAIIRTLFVEGGNIAGFLYHPNRQKYFNRRSSTPFSIQFQDCPKFHGLAGKRIEC
jgi:hypothetical protein